MENKYRFYVIDNKTIKYTDFLKEALIIFRDNKEDYKALGVEKNQISCCDLLIQDNGTLWISKDYTQMEEFKEDKLVLKAIEIFKEEISI